MEDYDTELFKNSIKYLHNISTLPEMNLPALKSSICLKRRLMELRKNTFVPSSAAKSNLHCKRCFLNFFDGPASYRIKSKPKTYNFANKILSKQKDGLPLTRYQEKYLKKNNKFQGNQLVITCKFCKYETNVKLDRPKTKPKPKNIPQALPKKKKKNKKDKYCSLNQTVVDSVTLNKSKSTNDSVIYLDSEEDQTPTRPKMKKKPEKPLVTSTPKITPETLLRSKKKDKARGKLTEILKKSSKKKNSPSHLLQFLQSL